MEADLTSALVQQAVSLEQSDRYQEAISSYLKAIQVMTDSLCSARRLTQWEKLEIQYNIDTSIARSRFLLKVSSISDNHELSSDYCGSSRNLCNSVPETVSNNVCSDAKSHESTSGKPPLPPRSSGVARSQDTSIKEQLLASVLIESPNITWDSIVGLECAKQPIREAILVPILYPDSIQAKNAWKGILLFGVKHVI
jgi:hypothetical protein